VLDEYCLRLEVDDFADWIDLFTNDTVYEVYGLTLRGRQEVADMLSKAPHGTHIGGATRILITGDAAETVQNYIFIATSNDEWNMGWYHRTLTRTTDGWKIAHTKVRFGRKEALPANARAAKLGYPISFG
jgi:hypothetical protein